MQQVLPRHRAGIYERFFKRPLDIVLSLMALIGLSPILIVTAIQVRRNLGSPVLFTQERPGRDERIFRLYKFRSMRDAVDAQGRPLPDSERLTPFGRRLRATSIDELPELLNILKGDMSVVGPRPLLVEYLPRYNAEQHRRHEVRPGLTGYAQAHGRNAITWEEKFEKDVYYVDHITFLGDMRIIWDTAMAVLRHKDINAGEGVTMPTFMGTKK